MSLVSSALRTVRGAYSRTSTRFRRPTVHASSSGTGRTGGGPFLHWVPDHPDGARLAGDYVPVVLDVEQQPAAPSRYRRRR